MSICAGGRAADFYPTASHGRIKENSTLCALFDFAVNAYETCEPMHSVLFPGPPIDDQAILFGKGPLFQELNAIDLHGADLSKSVLKFPLKFFFV